MAKDWSGNKKSTFVTLGANNHTNKERQREDYYATDPIAARLLLNVEPFEGKIWECACGEQHLARVFEEAGFEVRSSDLVDRCGNEVFDFLGIENCEPWDGQWASMALSEPLSKVLEFKDTIGVDYFMRFPLQRMWDEYFDKVLFKKG